MLKTSVPYVARVENRAPAVGGADAETLDEAKVRGPAAAALAGPRRHRRGLRGAGPRGRAGGGPGALRAQPARATGAGGVRVLVVPHVAGDEVGRIRRADLIPPEGDPRSGSPTASTSGGWSAPGCLVAPPDYVGLTAVVDVHARERYDPDEVRDDVLRALYRLFHPLDGGPDGTGWPFGRSVQSHEVHAALARIPGVDMAQEVRVTALPGRRRHRSAAGRRCSGSTCRRTALVFSYEHQVRVR